MESVGKLYIPELSMISRLTAAIKVFRAGFADNYCRISNSGILIAALCQL